MIPAAIDASQILSPGSGRSHPAQSSGVVTNQKTNPVRADVDRLRAILHNCALRGPNSQNRDNHSDFRNHRRGRVAFVKSLDPQKGARLRTIFDRIRW
jgi:hypothetical protein